MMQAGHITFMTNLLQPGEGLRRPTTVAKLPIPLSTPRAGNPAILLPVLIEKYMVFFFHPFV
jgi:hypothetical protein